MKVRKVASVPTVMSPVATCRPPNRRTSPIAAKNARVIAEVFRTRTSIRLWLSSSASLDDRSNFAIS